MKAVKVIKQNKHLFYERWWGFFPSLWKHKVLRALDAQTSDAITANPNTSASPREQRPKYVCVFTIQNG